MSAYDWHPFEVDGEPLLWAKLSTVITTNGMSRRELARQGRAKREEIELLVVARHPDRPGPALVLPAGSAVTEADAVEWVQRIKREGLHID